MEESILNLERKLLVLTAKHAAVANRSPEVCMYKFRREMELEKLSNRIAQILEELHAITSDNLYKL
jgi:hypothetical protein